MTRPKGSRNKPKDPSDFDDQLREGTGGGSPDTPPSGRRPQTPKGPVWKEAPSVLKTLTHTIETLGLGVGFINKIDGQYIEEGAEPLAKALVDIATVDPKFRRILVGASAPGKYGPLVMAIAGIAVPIAKNHAAIALERVENPPTANEEEIVRQAHVSTVIPVHDLSGVVDSDSITNEVDSATLEQEETTLPPGIVVPPN